MHKVESGLCWSQLVLAGESPLKHLFPALPSVMSTWSPEPGHRGNIYAIEIGKCHIQGLSTQPLTGRLYVFISVLLSAMDLAP